MEIKDSFKGEIECVDVAEEEVLIREMSSNADCFSFWNNPDEDLYQEYIKNKKEEK